MGTFWTRTPQASTPTRSTRVHLGTLSVASSQTLSVASLRTLSLAALLAVGCGKAPSQRIGQPSYPWAEEATKEEVFVPSARVEVPDAQLTIARSMPQFRRCFEEADAHGKVSLRLIIGRDGVVKRARGDGPVPQRVLRCVEAMAERTRFSPPEGSQVAQLDVPVAYYRQ